MRWERRAGAIQRQVPEAHRRQEVEPRTDLLRDLAGDLLRRSLQPQCGEEISRLAHRQRRDLDDAPPAQVDRGALGTEPRAAAGGAVGVGQKLAVPALGTLGGGLPEAAHEAGDCPLPGQVEAALAALSPPGDPELALGAGAVQDQAALLLGHPSPRCVDVDAELAQDLAAEPVRPLVLLEYVGAPRLDGTLVDAEAVVGNHQLGIDLEARSEPVAVGAHSLGTVEGEGLGRELGKRDAAVLAGRVLGEDAIPAILAHGDQRSLAHLESLLHGVRDPRGNCARHRDPVDHRLDRVLAALAQRRQVLDENDLAVDSQPQVALAAGLLEQLPVLALAVRQEWRQQHEPAAFPGRQQLPRDLLGGLRLHLPPAAVAVLNADPGEQHAQVVGDLGDGSDGGARIAALGLLLDGNGGRQTPNGVVLGLLHLAQELPRVGGERLDIAPLSLGVQGVEGQRGLSGARDSGHHHQLLLGNRDLDRLEIVFAGTLMRM
jgi:hypothetical protein